MILLIVIMITATVIIIIIIIIIIIVIIVIVIIEIVIIVIVILVIVILVIVLKIMCMLILVCEKVFNFLLGGRSISNSTREWEDLFKCQMKSGAYSDTPFLVVTAALPQSIIHIAIVQ